MASFMGKCRYLFLEGFRPMDSFETISIVLLIHLSIPPVIAFLGCDPHIRFPFQDTKPSQVLPSYHLHSSMPIHRSSSLLANGRNHAYHHHKTPARCICWKPGFTLVSASTIGHSPFQWAVAALALAYNFLYNVAMCPRISPRLTISPLQYCRFSAAASRLP